MEQRSRIRPNQAPGMLAVWGGGSGIMLQNPSMSSRSFFFNWGHKITGLLAIKCSSNYSEITHSRHTSFFHQMQNISVRVWVSDFAEGVAFPSGLSRSFLSLTRQGNILRHHYKKGRKGLTCWHADFFLFCTLTLVWIEEIIILIYCIQNRVRLFVRNNINFTCFCHFFSKTRDNSVTLLFLMLWKEKCAHKTFQLLQGQKI